MHASEISYIINQLDQTFDKNPWYGEPIHSILKSVDPDNVFESPTEGIHSIGELVAHLITYRVFATRRLLGDNDYYVSQENSFRWQRLYPEKKDAWDNLMGKLTTEHQHLLSILRESDGSILDKTVGGQSYSFRYLLNGIIQHDLYHLGQVVLIKKMNQRKHQAKPGPMNYSYKLFPFKDLSLIK
ncbi:Uncharacterized damage-inducible protein DinB (forms a four-helix bundle) [Fodinibius roseus]|uniref:Uncharacterized damage-inducible protein DinB (Forms a four-helix bundle) n=1 Tax=Fodinibius roseus TaxID=1194090 RepID=A0A1M4YTR6_9BACT|nr:DinB family protein [Fodinibius roseus]SHF08852.1 Uncharacterized damage-inducible protein DinB (forms a four-helix bundle) [Fodinibius roseus]